MSWCADLIVEVDGNEINVAEFNYTHNCNCMMSAVLEDAGHVLEKHWLIGHMGKSWFYVLEGIGGDKARETLELIINGMKKEPERFEAMNPENGWGSYDRVLKVLEEMLSKTKQFPSAKWRVCG
jgi:hypothetical protein